MPSYSSTSLEFGSMTRTLYFREHTSDVPVAQQIFVNENYDISRLGRFNELKAFMDRHEARNRRPLIVDAGANIGASALYFKAKIPTSRIVAIEPDPGNFDLLCRNVEGLDIETVHAAISSKPGRVRLLDPGQGAWAYRTEFLDAAESAPGAVACVTINKIYREHETAVPFIVKIDIEGAEQDLFSSDTEWVARTPIVVVELHDWMLPKAGTSRSFLQCISKLDRDFVHIGENIFSIANDLDGL